MSSSYLVNSKADLEVLRNTKIDLVNVNDAIIRCNAIIRQISTFEVDIFSILGMRNLSAFVGEVFAASLIKTSGELFRKNPHQDGYPDLLLMDDVGIALLEQLKSNMREKGPFSPFVGGGIEVKATCGSVPTPANCIRKGFHKPDIGDERVNVLKSYEWKAHHRETNYMMGIFWDFIDRVPTIGAVFYCNKLNSEDWGKIIQPKEGGGKTTSVSIMTRAGVKKMYDHWIAILNDQRYVDFFNHYNKDNRISI